MCSAPEAGAGNQGEKVARGRAASERGNVCGRGCPETPSPLNPHQPTPDLTLAVLRCRGHAGPCTAHSPSGEEGSRSTLYVGATVLSSSSG